MLTQFFFLFHLQKDVLSFIETRLPHLGSTTLMISFGTYAQAYNVAQGRDNPDSYRMGRTCNSHKSGLYPYSKVRNHLMITYCNSFTKNDRMEFTTVRVSQRYPTGDTDAPSCPRRFATPRFWRMRHVWRRRSKPGTPITKNGRNSSPMTMTPRYFEKWVLVIADVQ